ncbi:LytTR family DNA-binding domain-containing protein [Flavobacterium sp. 5]|uniref:LytR/AlgR family response regulator transcription factor n=1 Tax=Flavobacterium sp. 5 TaxID=2035199 RepID=UPI000C2C17B7|nr:LytTR family DNA-binding domain-containing protein [Flavobacterium sp. 5]PKB16224.1 LytTR family two component transcriptional regulator [Flavobacterium sp. 5]
MTPTRINCIIIEDELPASIVLEMHISKFDFLDLKGKFMSTNTALNVLKTQKIDLLFLDINLPGKSGIEFAKSLPKDIGIIFTTANPQYAVEGFELEAIDYLLKPISFERFSKAIDKYCKIQKTNQKIDQLEQTETERHFVFVKCERKMLKLYLDEIVYFESQGNYLLIHTEKDCFKTHQSITEMIEKLPEGLFCRIHRSFLITLKKVTKFNSRSVTIKNKILPIGRLYSTETITLLQSFVKN